MTGVLDVTGRILRLDPANHDALPLGSAPTGSRSSPAPKNAILKVLDHMIADRTGGQDQGRHRHGRPLTRAGALR